MYILEILADGEYDIDIYLLKNGLIYCGTPFGITTLSNILTNYDYYCFAPRGKLSYFYRQIKEIIDDYSLNASDTEMINNLLSQKKQLAAVLALYQTNKNMP